MILFSFATDIGKREKNEDFFGHYKNELFLMADGLGGHPGGEIASRLAVKAAIESFRVTKDLDPKERLKKCFKEANKTVYQEGLELGILGMGTTLVGAFIRENRFIIGNVGDSRAYLVRGISITQITYDQETDFEGLLLQAVGLDKVIRPDFYFSKLEKGDVLLLCTDGLTDYLRDEEILDILQEVGQTQKILDQGAKKLVNVAFNSGGNDNITVCLIKVI